MAAQRGLAPAREQDDVRGLQHWRGHGHHHTGCQQSMMIKSDHDFRVYDHDDQYHHTCHIVFGEGMDINIQLMRKST